MRLEGIYTINLRGNNSLIMKNYTLPQTEAAISFIESFSGIKRLIVLSDIITMGKGELAEISLSRVTKHNYSSAPLMWVDFVFSGAIAHFEDMSKELKGHIKINVAEIEDGEEIIEMLEKRFSELQENLVHKNILSKIEFYNTELKTSKTKGKEALILDVDIANDCEHIVGLILTKFKEYIKIAAKQVEERNKELPTTPPIRLGVPVEHKLRWNESEGSFDQFFKELIDLKYIQTASKGADPERILEILNIVFERLTIPKRKNIKGKVEGVEILIKKKVYISERLLWENEPEEFAVWFGPQIEKRAILIDKNQGTGAIQSVSKILQQIFFIEGPGGKDIKNTTLVKYLKEHRK